ncbi:hypothetical protein [Kitasatospora sp. NPDC086791]|uniref:hypothetical protein n=1 Tax=Kitasatospora sp. NPDC086791 TaxID=3155178 RepID=UPI00343E8ABD
MTASPALIDLEDAVRHSLTQAGFHLIDMDDYPDDDFDTGVAMTADIPYGCVIVGWNVHDDLAIGSYDAEQAGWDERHPTVARYRAVKAAGEQQ